MDGREVKVLNEEVKLANSQILERNFDKGKIWIDNLPNQATTHMLLTNKLKTFIKQRVVLDDALPEALKMVQQQAAADERVARRFTQIV